MEESQVWRLHKNGPSSMPLLCTAKQHKPNDGKCNRCVANKDNDEDWKCYHRHIVTDHVLNNLEDEIKALQEAMIYQIEQLEDSKLMVDKTPIQQ